MSEVLIPEDQIDALKNKRIDVIAAAMKAAANFIPLAGPVVAEAVGAIPGQRVDRIVEFLKELNREFEGVKEEVLRQKLKNDEFKALIEESMDASSKATTEERIKYIASIVGGNIQDIDVSYEDRRHMLGILKEINDIEVIWLMYYGAGRNLEKNRFYQKHTAILEPARSFLGSPREDIDKSAMQKEYKEHLCRLNLLQRNYRIDSKTKSPVFNNRGEQEVSGYQLTYFGGLFLRTITSGQEDETQTETNSFPYD